MLNRFINPSIRRTFLELPQLVVQPIQAREGTPSVDVEKVAQLAGNGTHFRDLICIRSREHWEQVVSGLPKDVDAVMLVSSPCYPTEIWNEAPEPLVRRGLPILFWPLVQHDEPDFWKWSCADLLRALGCKVHLIESNHEGVILLKAMAVKKFLAKSRMVVFGKQNFPWNAFAGAKGIEESLGLQLVIKSLSDYRQAGGNTPMRNCWTIGQNDKDATRTTSRRSQNSSPHCAHGSASVTFWMPNRRSASE